MGGVSGYAELQVTSNFSFLRGASHPKELVLAAQKLGYKAIAIADRNTFMATFTELAESFLASMSRNPLNSFAES